MTLEADLADPVKTSVATYSEHVDEYEITHASKMLDYVSCQVRPARPARSVRGLITERSSGSIARHRTGPVSPSIPHRRGPAGSENSGRHEVVENRRPRERDRRPTPIRPGGPAVISFGPSDDRGPVGTENPIWTML